jgi:hypothetical protein
MDGLIVGAVIFGTIAVILIGAGLNEYQISAATLAYQQAMKDTPGYSGGSNAGGMSIGGAYIKFGVGAALGAAGLVLYLLNRTADKDRKQSRLPDA